MAAPKDNIDIPEISATPVKMPLSPTLSETPSSDSSFQNPTPSLSRSDSFISTTEPDWEGIAQLDRLTVFDLLDNLALPTLALNTRIDKWNRSLQSQSEKLKRQSSYVKEGYMKTKEKVLKKRDSELERFQKRYGGGVDKLLVRWADQKVVTAREKFAFVAGVVNIFICGILIGGHTQYIPLFYTLQMFYFMPLRYYTYHKRGYHYFLADLCYFTNLLLLLSIWAFPQSRRLFISAYCLSYGNNAWAIAMWRNSLVFHSLDKVTSLFIHLMPPVVLHAIVHQDAMRGKMKGVERLREEGGFSLLEMVGWASIPYVFWQACYHVFITIRRKDKIAAGRPTSFTWLRKSYSKTWIGKQVLRLPEPLQEFAFMGIQYAYAVLTMLPAPLWYRYRYLSAAFLSAVALWSVYNGATFYIDVFGKRFEKELEALRKDLERWQASPAGAVTPGTGMGAVPEEQRHTVAAGEEANYFNLDKTGMNGGSSTGHSRMGSMASDTSGMGDSGSGNLTSASGTDISVQGNMKAVMGASVGEDANEIRERTPRA